MLTVSGHSLDQDSDRFAELQDANELLSQPNALRTRMDESGYLFFRGLLDPELVMQARLEVLGKFAILGEIDDRFPVDQAVAGSRQGLASANLRAFSESVRSGYWYRQVTDHPHVATVIESLLLGSVRCFDFRWPRLVRPGENCGFHCDGPYMARGTSTDRIFTCWVPLGDVPKDEGALLLLEGSHRSTRLQEGYLQKDADRDGLTWLDSDPEQVRQQFGTRWLSADFNAGDVLCFSMNMLHGSLDNQSVKQRCRLSSDTRYQRADEPADPRWNGQSIEAHGGSRVFYPGLGRWKNADFADEWKLVDEFGCLQLPTQGSPD